MQELTLNPRARAFVAEFKIDRNATQAAIRAGFSAKTARQAGARLLSKAHVKAALSVQAVTQEREAAITADRVLQELARISLSDSRRLFDENGKLKAIKDWSLEDSACVASIKVTRRIVEKATDERPAVIEETHDIKLWDKVASLAKVGQHLGMFVERSQQLGPDGRPIDPRQPVVFVLDRG